MNELDILDQIESVSGKNDKRSILKEHSSNTRLAELLDAALNFNRKFHIKKFDIKDTQGDKPEADVHRGFITLLHILETRSMTGNAAIELVESFLEKLNDQQQKWYSRIIRKDLRSGFSIESANKSGFKIPEFKVQLATDGLKCKKLKEICDKGVFVSPKLDGYRCVAIVHRGNVSLHSRNGTHMTNFPTIEKSLLEIFGNQVSVVLDGEIMSDDFNAMQKSAFANKRGTTVGDVSYHVFDMMDWKEWNIGEPFKTKASDRYHSLITILVTIPDNIKIVPHIFVKSLECAKDYERRFMEQGHEGAMLNPDIPYYLGKKANRMLKLKTMLSMEATITGFYEGTGKYENMMGGIHVRQETGVNCDVGTGFSDQDREYIFNNQSEFLGKTIEVKYQELSKDGVMRFPVFMRFRNDK